MSDATSQPGSQTETFTAFLDRKMHQDRRDALLEQIAKLNRVEKVTFSDPEPSFGHRYKVEVRYRFPVGNSIEETVARMPGVTQVKASDGRIIPGTPSTPAQLAPVTDPDDDGAPIPVFKQCHVFLSHTVPHGEREAYEARIKALQGVLHAHFEDAAGPFRTLRTLSVSYAEGHDVTMRLKNMRGVSGIHGGFASGIDMTLDTEKKKEVAAAVHDIKGVVRVDFMRVSSPWAEEHPIRVIHDCSNLNVEREVAQVPGIGPAARKLASG